MKKLILTKRLKKESETPIGYRVVLQLQQMSHKQRRQIQNKN